MDQPEPSVGLRQLLAAFVQALPSRALDCLDTFRLHRARLEQAGATTLRAPALRGGGAGEEPEAETESAERRKAGKSKKRKEKDGLTKKKKPVSLEGLEAALKEGEVTPEEVELLRDIAWGAILANETTKWNGKKMTLMDLSREAATERKLHAVGGDEPTSRLEQDAKLIDALPSTELRLDQHKMMLRPREQDQLPLDLLGQGHAFSPAPLFGMRFGGQRDYTFGIYGNGRKLTELLREKWSGIPPEEVIPRQGLYDDLLKLAPAAELTVMAMPVRRVRMSSLVDSFRSRIAATLAATAGTTEEDSRALNTMAARFTPEHLEGSGLLDEKGRLLQDSNFIFTVAPRGQLAVEAVTPGTLRDKSAVIIGSWSSQAVSYSLMSQFLGEQPIDPAAKLAVGHALLFLANGFDLHTTGAERKVKNQFLMNDDGSPMFPLPDEELIPATPEVFSYSSRQRRPVLDYVRRGMRQYKQLQAQQQQQEEEDDMRPREQKEEELV